MFRFDAIATLIRRCEELGVLPEERRAAAAEMTWRRVADIDPRRARSLQVAEKVDRALRAGATPAQVRGRFGLSRSAYYRAVQLSRESRDALVRGSPQFNTEDRQ